jgi:hypothetical protein
MDDLCDIPQLEDLENHTVAKLIYIIKNLTNDLTKTRIDLQGSEKKSELLEQTVIRQNDDVKTLFEALEKQNTYVQSLETTMQGLRRALKLQAVEIRKMREKADEAQAQAQTQIQAETEPPGEVAAETPRLQPISAATQSSDYRDLSSRQSSDYRDLSSRQPVVPNNVPVKSNLLRPEIMITQEKNPIDTYTYTPSEEYSMQVSMSIIKDALRHHEDIATRYHHGGGISAFEVQEQELSQTQTQKKGSQQKGRFSPFIRTVEKKYIHSVQFLITTIAYSNQFLEILMDRVQRLELFRRTIWTCMQPMMDVFQNSKPLFQMAKFKPFEPNVDAYRNILSVTPHTNPDHLQPMSMVKCIVRINNSSSDSASDIESSPLDKLRIYMAQIVVFFQEFGVLICRTGSKYVTFSSIKGEFYERISFSEDFTLKYRTVIYTTLEKPTSETTSTTSTTPTSSPKVLTSPDFPKTKVVCVGKMMGS